MDNSINNLDWNSYKNLYDITEHPTVRTFHWSPLFYSTNGEYIAKPNPLYDRVDEGFLGGQGVYSSTDVNMGRPYSTGNMGGSNPKLIRQDVVGFDIPYEQFVDISKPLNEQTEYIQQAVKEYRNRGGLVDFWDEVGKLKELPSIDKPDTWNNLMEQLHPYGVLGVYDREGYAGEPDTFSYRYLKDMPKGYLAGRGENTNPNIAPELFGNTPDSFPNSTYKNKMKDVSLPSIEKKYLNPVGLDTHIKESVAPDIQKYYRDKATNILSNTLSDDNLKLMSRMEINDEIDILSRELMLNDYMKVHPEGIIVDNNTTIVPNNTIIPKEVQEQFDNMIDNIMSETYNSPSKSSEQPKLSTPARNITKQTPKPRVQVKQPTITPKQIDVPLGARLYEAGLNPKELVKLAKDPKVLSEVTKSLSKAITNPKTYLELGRGLVSPINIGLIASDILVNKADQAVHNRLKGRYNIKSQAEFNKLYPTLSTFERGQLGNTYPEMYQTYMKGR